MLMVTSSLIILLVTYKRDKQHLGHPCCCCHSSCRDECVCLFRWHCQQALLLPRFYKREAPPPSAGTHIHAPSTNQLYINRNSKQPDSGLQSGTTTSSINSTVNFQASGSLCLSQSIGSMVLLLPEGMFLRTIPFFSSGQPNSQHNSLQTQVCKRPYVLYTTTNSRSAYHSLHNCPHCDKG